MGETSTAIFLSLFLVGGFLSVLAGLLVSNKPTKSTVSSNKKTA